MTALPVAMSAITPSISIARKMPVIMALVRTFGSASKTPASTIAYVVGPSGSSGNTSEIVSGFADASGAGSPTVLVGQSAREVRRLVDTARAVVASDLRVGAEWPRAIDFALGAVCCDHARRSFSLLDPPLNEANFVERVGTLSTDAMSHAGHHEKTNPIRALS